MKKLIVLSLIAFLFASFGIYKVDEYSVIKVIGGITHVKNNQALFTGDKILSNERLKFTTEQSRAALVNKTKGRLMLRPSKSGTVQEGLMPALTNVSSRSGALINALDIKNHFSERYLILPDYHIEMNPKSYPMDKEHFFFLRFNYEGESISKKLPFAENQLQLKANEILKIDGIPIHLEEGTPFELVYRNNTTKSSETLAKFEPVFAKEKELKAECQLILHEFGENLSAQEKKEQILAYLTENYGKPHRDNLDIWLAKNFDF